MKKENFKIGEEIEIKVFWYDEDGNKFSKKIKGKVAQATNDFLVLNNGFYNESFKYSELIEKNEIQPSDEPYDLNIEIYEDDIVTDCINSLNKDEKGCVFNKVQKEKVENVLCQENIQFTCNKKDNIYYFKKV